MNSCFVNATRSLAVTCKLTFLLEKIVVSNLKCSGPIIKAIINRKVRKKQTDGWYNN